MTIYYCYEKNTGRFAGSGIIPIDNTEIGCTTNEYPVYNNTIDIPYWVNNKWSIRKK
jgi:hypothetical protein